MKNIYLTGMMGCGKSTVGKVLADQKKLIFADTDSLIADREEKTIKEIFADSGEEYFRSVESKVLKNVSNNIEWVVSCGGGMILSDENIKIMKKTGVIIYVYRDIEDIEKDITTQNRPLLNKTASNIRSIFDRRKGRYENSADYVIINDKAPEDAAKKIIELLGL